MADFKITKQSAESIYQGETLFIGSEQSGATAARLDALLDRIDRERTATGEWADLRAEVENARRALPESTPAISALERAREVASSLRATSIVAAISTVIGSFVQ
ncbi:hypothetical protein OHS59_22275 [Streptomyces sp. NBC_00414]|uniref:hypothetical protein n=1 Tax=Streptomyces sp. NBC_00414 TaxID=2975739 RepID=UPI002E1F69FA